MQDRCEETLQETVRLHISNHDSEFNKISELIFFSEVVCRRIFRMFATFLHGNCHFLCNIIYRHTIFRMKRCHLEHESTIKAYNSIRAELIPQ